MMKGQSVVKGLAVVVCLLMLSASSVMAQDFCKGDFNYNGSVAAEDVEIFLEDFGRSQFNNPCPSDGPTPVPKTGQTTSYASYDDGDLERGVAWPNPRFTDNGDGTVTDNLTGLIWLKDANCFGYRNWWEALTDCNVLADGECGLTDGSSGGQWRLPNRLELESLLDFKYWQPALSNIAGTGQWTPGDPFIKLQTGDGYWSSTSIAHSSEFAFYVSMFDGGIDGSEKGSHVYYVWPVRGGQ